MDPFDLTELSDADLKLIFGFLDSQPRPTTGAGLFKDFCANCHGADGSGGGPVNRDIRTEIAKADDKVRNGNQVGNYGNRHEAMPKFSETALTPAEFDMIKQFMQNGFQ